MHSVALTDIPYTGFDYGEPNNSLFWVALAIWSLVVSYIIIRNKTRIGARINALARMFMVARPVPEPRFVHERVVLPPVTQSTVSAPPVPSVPVRTEVVSEVAQLVAEELAQSRAGDFVDEFTEDDFATVDFDGVNPDDSWVSQPAPVARSEKPPLVVPPQTVVVPPPSIMPKVPTPVVRNVVPLPPVVRVPEPTTAVYTDTLTLTTVGGLPKLVLTREVIA